MLLLTGATGRVGSALLTRLTGDVAQRAPLAASRPGETYVPVRCLVRDPRRLGDDRVRVQLALGDLADPSSFRHALRGVKTVVHLAATERDQPGATLEEVNALATWRLLRAAEREGVQHFVFLTPLGATPHHRSRVHRSKALAERAVLDADLPTSVLRCSLIYAPGDTKLALLDLLSRFPAVPVTQTMKRARTQPVWSDDVAACVQAVIDRGASGTLDIAGPETLSQRDAIATVLAARGRPRRLVTLPTHLLLPVLHAYEVASGPVALATRDEADVMGATMLSSRGTADAEALGVSPLPVSQVLRA